MAIDIEMAQTFAKFTLEPGARPGTYIPIGHDDVACTPEAPTITLDAIVSTDGNDPWPCGKCVPADGVNRLTGEVKTAFPGSSEISEAEVNSLAPQYRAPGTKLRGRQYGNGSDAPATRKQKTEAERAGVSVAGKTQAQAAKAISAVKAPSDKSMNFAKNLIAERDGDKVAAIRARLNAAAKDRVLSQSMVSAAIKELLTIEKTIRQTPPPSLSSTSAPQVAPSAPQVAKRITNRYPGKCGSCGQSVDAGEGIWQIDDQGNRGVFHLDGQCPISDLGIPTGRYAVEHEGVLKFYNLKVNGLFVMASDEEHRIKSNATIEAVAELIKVDPIAAMRRFGHEIGKCGRCGRTLTDEISRQNGIGPICEAKAWG